MESKLIELASQSRKGLELGKNFCTRANFISIEIEEILNFIELFWPKLKFIQIYLKDRIKNFQNLLIIGEFSFNKVNKIIQLKLKQKTDLYQNLEVLLHNLKSVKITHLPSFTNSQLLQSPLNLIDYLDWNTVTELKTQLNTNIETFLNLESQLKTSINEFSQVLEDLLNELPEDHDSVSLEESGVNYSKSKLKDHEGRTESMARILGSLERHHSQVTGVLKAFKLGEVGQQVDLYILERDSEELPNILEELEQSLEVIELLKQDAIVRHQLFEAIYQEKFQTLRKLILNIKLYLKFSRLIKQVETEFNQNLIELDSIIEELWQIEKKYSGCIQAYQHVEQEYKRREQVQLHQQQIIHQFQLNLDRFYNDEKKTREEFIQKIEDYLPSGLSQSIRELPYKYSITQVVESSSPFTMEPNFELNLSGNTNNMGFGFGVNSGNDNGGGAGGEDNIEEGGDQEEQN